PKRVELALQSAPAGLVGEHHGVEALDGDLVAGLLVDRPPDLGGAAGARGRDEPVAIEQDGLGHARIVPKPASRRSIRRLAVALQFRDGVRCRRAPNRSRPNDVPCGLLRRTLSSIGRAAAVYALLFGAV